MCLCKNYYTTQQQHTVGIQQLSLALQTTKLSSPTDGVVTSETTTPSSPTWLSSSSPSSADSSPLLLPPPFSQAESSLWAPPLLLLPRPPAPIAQVVEPSSLASSTPVVSPPPAVTTSSETESDEKLEVSPTTTNEKKSSVVAAQLVEWANASWDAQEWQEAYNHAEQALESMKGDDSLFFEQRLKATLLMSRALARQGGQSRRALALMRDARELIQKQRRYHQRRSQSMSVLVESNTTPALQKNLHASFSSMEESASTPSDGRTGAEAMEESTATTAVPTPFDTSSITETEESSQEGGEEEPPPPESKKRVTFVGCSAGEEDSPPAGFPTMVSDQDRHQLQARVSAGQLERVRKRRHLLQRRKSSRRGGRHVACKVSYASSPHRRHESFSSSSEEAEEEGDGTVVAIVEAASGDAAASKSWSWSSCLYNLCKAPSSMEEHFG